MPKKRSSGKTSPFVRSGYFICAICEGAHERHSNAQKYCDRCRLFANSLQVAEYYRKNRDEILKAREEYRKQNREKLREASRSYHQETKAENLTRKEMRGDE